MADINAYALGLELQLQTKSAIDSLSAIEKKLQNIEQKMAGVAPTAVSTTALEKQAQAVGLNSFEYDELDKAVYKSWQTMEKLAKMNREVAMGAEFANLSFEEQQKHLQKITEQSHEVKAVLKELSKSYKSMNEDQQSIFDLGVKDLKQTEEYLEQHKDVQEQLEKHSKIIKILKPLLSAMGVSEAEATQFAFAFSKGMGLAAIAAALLVKGLKDVMEMQEAYAKTTFRALGTQLQMIDNTNALKSTLGATTEEAVKSFTALANVGFKASDSVNDLAAANYMFAKSSGVSEGQTAIYQRALTLVGVSSHGTSISLGEMSAAIRNSGMSAQQAGALIDQLSKSMLRLKFGFDPKLAKGMTDSMAQFGAAVQKTGGDVNATTAMFAQLAEEPPKMMEALGVLNLDTTGTQLQRMNRLMEQGPAAIKKFMDAQGEMGIMVLNNIGLNVDAMRSIEGVGEAAGWSADKVRAFTKNMTSGADLTEDFNKAMATFKQTMQRILTPLLTIGSQLMNIVGPAIVILLKPLVMLATTIGHIVTFVDKLGLTGLILKGIVVGKLAPSIFRLVTTFSGLGKLFPGITKSIVGMTGMFRSAVPVIGTLGGALLKQVAMGKLFSKETGGIIARLGGITKAIFMAKNAAGGATGVIGGLGAAAEGAGGGFMGMSGGALSMAMNLAKAHPVIAAVVAAIAGAFLIVPKLFEMFNSGSAATSALALALMSLFAPLVGVYVTLRTLWAVAKGVWEAISELATEAFKPLTEALKVFNGPGGKSVSLMDVFNKAMNKLTIATKVFMKAFTPVVFLFKMLGSIVGFVVEGIKKAIDKFAPVIRFAEWAINKISKFLGLDEDAAEKTQAATEDMRTAYEKMWGTQKQIAEGQKATAAAMQIKNTTKELINPELMHKVQTMYAPPIKQAEPVVSPTINDKTARAKTEEHNDKMLNSNMIIGETLVKMLSKVDNKTDIHQLLELLKVWLPKIAEEKSAGLSTAANQWV